MTKAICAMCFLAYVVQVWSSDVVIDGEVKVKEDVPCNGSGAVKDGREAWIEGPRGRVTSREG
jgi:hypothetical protein